MVVPNSPVLQHSYRHLGDGHTSAARHLSVAADALNMALLTLDGSPDDGRGAKLGRAATARHFLAEAALGLARARVHVPGIRTYAVNVVTASEPDVDRELARLHELTTKLLWRNHTVLPGRKKAQPLAPEDEAQLAAVVRDLATHARIDRAMRHKWLVAAAVFGFLAPVLGVALYLLAAASGTFAAVELARGAAPPVLPAG
ncbi:hypothetical protein ENSA5_51770 [Enhygromyxa salina]|uniref:Uncharacterized protein n=1 Tax=Enhygromyxa salina TaxID=215803 RepID=A0A2S9XGG7_9BACT|nr:hypothetical protein [Enhygromyxa salina]PRP91966.1 hypothetical protein ENSA5_51770 [Enhygromyxa salina]